MFNQILLLNTLILGDVSPFYRTISDSTSVGESLANSMTAQLTLEELITLAATLSDVSGMSYDEVLAELLTLNETLTNIVGAQVALAELLTLRDKEPAVIGTIFEDTFTEVDATSIQYRDTDSGHRWLKLQGPDAVVESNKAVAGSTWDGLTAYPSFYLADVTPQTPTYDIEADFTLLDAQASLHLYGRLDTSASYKYYQVYYQSGTWQLIVYSGGSTTLASYHEAWTVGQTKNIRLSVSNTAKTVYLDDVQIMTSSNNAVTATGRAGFSVLTFEGVDGFNIDNFKISGNLNPLGVEWNMAKLGQLLDTITARETLTPQRGFKKTNSETITLSETQIANVGKLIADYFRASEQIVVNWHGGLTLADRCMLFDTPTAARGFLTALTDVVTNSDTIVAALGINLRDQVRAADSVTGAWQGIKTILEVLTAADQATPAQGFGAALADVLALTDNPLLLFAAAVFAADTIAVSGAATTERTVDSHLASTLTITESIEPNTQLNGQLADTVTFNFKVTLNGEVYQCWSFTTDEMYPSLFTNYEFTSYTNVNDRVYATKPDGIYLLEGADDAGKRIESGIKLDFGSMGSHLKKRLFYAYFGLVGEEPALRVITDSGEIDYYVVNGQAKLAHGAIGRDWQLILTDIDALDFVEITPVILSR